MKDFLTLKRIKLLCGSLSVFFLLIHAILFFIFKRYNVTPMVHLNILSIVFYLIMLVLVLKDRFYAFVTATFLEIIPGNRRQKQNKRQRGHRAHRRSGFAVDPAAPLPFRRTVFSTVHPVFSPSACLIRGIKTF